MGLEEVSCEGALGRARQGGSKLMSKVRRASKGRVVLAGGSGFLGRALAEEFVREGYEVVVLTRRPSKVSRTRAREVAWDGRNVCASWARELEGAAVLVNLTGRSVNCRYTAE